MKQTLLLDVPTLFFVVGTRAMLGLGAGLLLAERLPRDRRRTAGMGLLAAGVLTTIPAASAVRRAIHGARRWMPSQTLAAARIEQDDRLKGVTRFARKGDDELAP